MYNMITITALVCFLAFSSGVEAKAKSKSNKGGSSAVGLALFGAKKVYGQDIMSQSHVLECLKSEKSLDEKEKSYEADENKYLKVVEKFEALELLIDSEEKTLDDTSQYEIDKFNEKIGQYNELNNDLLVQETKLEKDLSSYNTLVDTYNSSCVDKSFYLEDRDIGEKKLNFQSKFMRDET